MQNARTKQVGEKAFGRKENTMKNHSSNKEPENLSETLM